MLKVRTASSSRTLGVLFVLLFASFSPVQAFDKLPESHPTYQAVKNVYQNLVRAIGSWRKPPRLYVKPAASKGPDVSMIYTGSEGLLSSKQQYRESSIVIDERAFDLAQKEFGSKRDSALAFLIGHELVHFYNNQGWVAEFGNGFADAELGRKMRRAAETDEVVRYEAEADRFGGFYAYLAGYDALGVAPAFLEKIYAHFNLPSEIIGYPSKEQRKKIALDSQKGLQEMVPLFETANRLVVIGRYEEAARLFDFIGRTFPTREMFNNAGVARALAALGLFRSGELKYAFPFEFDAETRLRVKLQTRAAGDADEERRRELLEQAARDFDSAIARDPNYAVPYLNRAAVLEMADDHARAQLDADRALALAREQQEETTVANAHLVRGIIAARQQSAEKAVADFEAAKGKAEFLAALNLREMTKGAAGKAPAPKQKPKSASDSVEELIGGLIPGELMLRVTTGGAAVSPLNPPTVEKELSEALDDNNSIRIAIKETDKWIGSAINAGDYMLYLLATPPGYQGASGRGVRVGSSLEELERLYGQASRVVPSRQGTCYAYTSARIVFCVAGDGKVTGWMTYLSVKR